MGWPIVVLVVVGVITAVALWWRADEVRTSDVDPLFMAGIPLAGAGVALMTTVGVAGYLMLAVGLVLLVVGGWRSRRRPG